jgi:hypothetical protein
MLLTDSSKKLGPAILANNLQASGCISQYKRENRSIRRLQVEIAGLSYLKYAKYD